jgi:2-dehydropantoate 2-reductase
MRVAVMAAGALGGYFGGRLAEAGHEVHFIARGANLAALKANGLRVKSPDGNLHIAKPSVTDDPKSIGEADLVFFAVKLWDVEKSGEAAKPLVGKNTRVLSMLNGIDSVDRLAPILGKDVVAACPTRISAVISEPGVILHKALPPTFICGFMDGRDDARLQSLVDEMQGAKFGAKFSKEIEKDLWKKYVFLNGMSGATAGLRATLGEIRGDADTMAVLEALMREAEAVGVKKGVPLQGYAEKAIGFAKAGPAGAKASMAEDLDRGNRLETDWLQGKIVELGKKLGVPAPVNRDIYAVLKLHRMGKNK